MSELEFDPRQTLPTEIEPLEAQLRIQVDELLTQLSPAQQEAVQEMITEKLQAAYLEAWYDIAADVRNRVKAEHHRVESETTVTPPVAEPAELTGEEYQRLLTQLQRLINARPEDEELKSYHDLLLYLEAELKNQGVNPLDNPKLVEVWQEAHQLIDVHHRQLRETQEMVALTEAQLQQVEDGKEVLEQCERLVFQVASAEAKVHLYLLETYSLGQVFEGKTLVDGLLFQPRYQALSRPTKGEMLTLQHGDQLEYTYLARNDKRYSKTFIFSTATGKWMEKHKSSLEES